MRPNLDSLTEEIQHCLEQEQFVVFRSISRAGDAQNTVYWESNRYPDFRAFLDCALKLGVRLIHFNTQEFTSDHRQDALDSLEAAELPREEFRDLERRIKELALYEGFLCSLELSFDFDGKTYFFGLETEWYEEYHDILDDIDMVTPGGEDEPGSYGGYFSQN